MLKQSFFVNVIIKIYGFFALIIKNSFFWNYLSSLNRKFNASAEKSAIVCAFSSESTADEKYGQRYGKLFAIISAFFSKCFLWLARSVKSSVIVTFVVKICEGFITVPLKYPGFLLLTWGGISLVGNYIMGAKYTALLICAFLVVLGIVLILVKQSLKVLFSNSIILNRFMPNIHTEICYEWGVKLFLTIGIALGLLSSILGILPVAVSVALFVIVVIGFNYTGQVAVLYVCVLPFMPTMAMVGGGLALFLCVAIKSVLGYKDKLFSKSYLLNMYLLFMGIAFILSTIFSYARSSSVKIAMVYIAFLLASYALIRILSEKKILLVLLNGISLFSIPVSLYGIYQHFSGFDKQNTWIDTQMFEDISGRVVSFFGNPNVFGEYLILIILTSTICFFISQSYKVKTIHLFAAGCSLISLVFTYSRGCWIGIVFALVIFLFMSKRKLFLAFCVLGAVSVFFLPESIITRIASVGNLADSSTSYRVYIWEGTLNMLKDFWVTGIGLGSDAFNAVYPFYAYSAITAPHPHNLYLVVLTETGIVGAIAFVLIVLIYYKKLFGVIRNSNDKNAKLIASGLIAGMSGFLLQGMFDNVWYNYRVFLLFWIYIAIGAAVDIVFRRTKA